jgi:hypothetical protein
MWWIYPAISAATNIAGQMLNKPKQRQAQTSYYDRLINNLRGGTARRDYRRNMTEAAMQPLSTANRRNQEAIQYGTQPGAERATAVLAGNQQFMQGATQVGLNAAAAEAQQQQQTSNQIAELEARREDMIEAERRRYSDDVDAWRRNWGMVGMQAAGEFAAAGAQNMATQAAETAAQTQQVKGALDVGYDNYINSMPADAQMPPLSRELYESQYQQSGFATPEGFNQSMLPKQAGKENTIQVTYTDEQGNKVVQDVLDTDENRTALGVQSGTKSITRAKPAPENVMKVTQYNEDGVQIVQEIDVNAENLKSLGLPSDVAGVKSVSYPKPEDDSDMVTFNTYDAASDSYVSYEVPRSEFDEEFGNTYPEGTKSVRLGKPGEDRSAEAEQHLIDLKYNIKLLDSGEGSGQLRDMIDNIEHYEDSEIAGNIYEFVQKVNIPEGGIEFTASNGETIRLGTGSDTASKRRSLYNGLSQLVWRYKKLKGGGGGGSLSEAIERMGLDL